MHKACQEGVEVERVKKRTMKQKTLLFLSFLLLTGCAQKDPEEEAKDLDRMVRPTSQRKQGTEERESNEEKITTVGDKK